jgi:hypothetical protein
MTTTTNEEKTLYIFPQIAYRELKIGQEGSLPCCHNIEFPKLLVFES